MTPRARTALFLLLIFLGTVGSTVAQENYTVVDVVVEGNRIATESLIRGVAAIEKGAQLSPASLSDTIRRLYGLGMFSDVRVDVESVDGGLMVYIVVKELPRLSALRFEGNKKIKDDKFIEKLGLGVGGYISPFLVHEKRSQIAAMYAEKGYFRAEVEPRLEYSADSSEASLTYRIEERSKVKVEQVVVEGNSRVSDKAAIKDMRNRKRGFLRSSDFAQEKYEEDLEKVIEAFHRRGFIDAYLVSDSTHIDTTRNRMTVYLEVYEGPRYYFGDISFEGCERLPAEALQKMVKVQPGDVFDTEKFDKSFEQIYTAYYEIGHLHMQADDERTTRADSIIDITYRITEGLPSHIHMVHVVGNYRTKEKVVRREIKSLPGQIFNQSLLIRSIREVMALNFFENVVPAPLALPNGDVDLEFTVKEKRTAQIMAGAGYNSQDKLVGNVGIGIPNFRGNGQSVQFNVDFGKNRNSFSLSFTEPWLYGRPTLLSVSAYTINRRWFDEYTEARQGGSIQVGRRLRWPDNYFRIYASYELERNRYYDYEDELVEDNSYKSAYWYDNPNTSTVGDLLLAQRYHGSYPGAITSYNEEWLTASRVAVNIKRDSRNLPQFATSGSVLSYTFENTGGVLGGFWRYQKHRIEVAKFIPLFWKFSLGLRAEYGVVTSPAGDDRITVSDRFTPGGTYYDGTVRGYEGGALTPDSVIRAADTVFLYSDPNALVGIDPPADTLFNTYTTKVRGKYMLVGNVELQFPITEQQIYLLGFLDAGNSWLHRRDIKPLTDLYRGIGVGFRIVLPALGTLGFDFGYRLDDFRGEGKGWKPHFQYGATF